MSLKDFGASRAWGCRVKTFKGRLKTLNCRARNRMEYKDPGSRGEKLGREAQDRGAGWGWEGPKG